MGARHKREGFYRGSSYGCCCCTCFFSNWFGLVFVCMSMFVLVPAIHVAYELIIEDSIVVGGMAFGSFSMIIKAAISVGRALLYVFSGVAWNGGVSVLHWVITTVGYFLLNNLYLSMGVALVASVIVLNTI